MSADRPRCYVTNAVLVSGWPAFFLGLSRVRRALEEELYDLPAGLPATEIVDVLDACRVAGHEWISGVRGRKSEARESEAVSHSENEQLTTTEAADVLGVTPRRVRQLAEAGQLPACRVGSRWRFSLSAIEAARKDD